MKTDYTKAKPYPAMKLDGPRFGRMALHGRTKPMTFGRVNLRMESLSIDDVERLYKYGSISENDVIEYLRKWNAGPHYNRAVLTGGRIRLFDPEKSGVFYRHLYKKFGIKG